MVKRLFSLFLIVILFLVSCGKQQAKDVVDALPVIFPDYTEVTVPSTIAPLNFQVVGANHVQARFLNSSGDEILVDGDDAIIVDEAEWPSFLSKGGSIEVQVSVWNDEHPDGARYKSFHVYVSQDPIDPYVVYRLIPPGYEGWNEMGIYERELASFEVKTLVDNGSNKDMCMNCHTSNAGDASSYLYHVRGKNGYTLMHHDGVDEKVDLPQLAAGRHGSHPSWHPSGRYVAFSSNDTKQIFYGRSQDKIEVFDAWSDLFIYDIKNKQTILDERFTDSLHWETYPCFSPDGKWLYFSTAKPVHMPEEATQLCYDLVRVPFDEMTGSLGDVDTIYSVQRRGGTALMPRITPDGQFLIYTIADYGAFNLYHKEADFEMIRLSQYPSSSNCSTIGDTSLAVSDRFASPECRVDCRAINSNDAESYHSWSSNGRWMLFSSKRIDGRYTRLFIVHWDGKQWGKPFLLPQQDPSHNTFLMMAYNVAEFRK